MTTIPEVVRESAASRIIQDHGYPLLYRGKVGELFEVPDKPDQLLMMRSDRLSIFDFVLPCEVERKGEVLTALTHYWLTQVFPDVPNHLLAWGMNEDLWAKAGWNMGDVQLLPLERTLLVRRSEVWPYEMIYRAHLGGSVWKDYETTDKVAGVELPSGLKKWQKLTLPIFTPTTKAEDGHDEKLTLDEYPEETRDSNGATPSGRCFNIYHRAYDHALTKSIVILDTKFEVSPDGRLLDEVLTPDSSRFTTPEDLEAAIAEGRDPIFYDKEPIRIWGRKIGTPWGVGINKLDPSNYEHCEFVASLQIPFDVVDEASARYLDIGQRLTLLQLDKYQLIEMMISD